MKNFIYVCFLKNKNMDSIAAIDRKIQEAKDKRRKLIIEAMDGRTQKYISDKTGIDEPRLSQWINGLRILEDSELEKISNALGVDFK